MKILITAGPTLEPIDPVRFLSNRSSGKMGYAMVKAALQMGHACCLISGPVSLDWPEGATGAMVTTANEMFEAVKKIHHDYDIIIMSAAVADYSPRQQLDSKHKKSESETSWNLELEKTKDILKYLGHHRVGEQLITGFCLETDNLLENAQKKRASKNADVIFANPAESLESDDSHCYVVTKEGVDDWALMSKEELAKKILKFVCKQAEEFCHG